MSHSNIALFVAHLGCPNMCSFCNQHSITNHASTPTALDVKNAVNTAMGSKNYDKSNGEIAFFGGSFTAIDREYMLELLTAAKSEIDLKNAKGIRISTRPDCIDNEILTLLKEYGVTAIELGAQSMNDEVLLKNRRGHTAQDVITASHLIKDFGFQLGLQMMTGLYGDNDEKSIETAKKIISLNPDTIRIYPTVVFKNTHLDKLRESGEYIPQTVENAVKLGAKLIPLFEKNGIKVIRFGLHTADESEITGGAWHPALAQLVKSQIFKTNIENKLTKLPIGNYIINCNSKNVSDIIGQKRTNVEYFSKLGYNCIVKPKTEIKENHFLITERKN